MKAESRVRHVGDAVGIFELFPRWCRVEAAKLTTPAPMDVVVEILFGSPPITRDMEPLDHAAVAQLTPIGLAIFPKLFRILKFWLYAKCIAHEDRHQQIACQRSSLQRSSDAKVFAECVAERRGFVSRTQLASARLGTQELVDQGCRS